MAGIGFTMALFIANLAYSPEQLSEAKLGILLASAFSALAGFGLFRYIAKVNENACKSE